MYQEEHHHHHHHKHHHHEDEYSTNQYQTNVQYQTQPVFVQQQVVYVQPQPPIAIVPPGANPLLYQLALLPALYIKEKFNVLQAITGCENKNIYHIYAADENGNIPHGMKHESIFRAKEHSNWCEKNCLPGHCRPFVLHIWQEFANGDRQEVMKLYRSCRCTVCCCNRPHMDIFLINNGIEVNIGKAFWPWTLCDPTLSVYGQNDELIYQVVSDCCQCGWWCRLPCDSCATVRFHIQDCSGNHLSTMQRENQSCIKTAISNTNNFRLVLPSNSTPEQKALLMATTLMIDYSFFEENNEDSNDILA